MASLAEVLSADSVPSVDSVGEVIDTLVDAVADAVGDAGTTVFAIAASGVLEAETAAQQSGGDAAGSADTSTPTDLSTNEATEERSSGVVTDASGLTEMWRTIGLLAMDQQSEWAEGGADDLDGTEPATSVNLFSQLGSL